jgi:hypothetical protein
MLVAINGLLDAPVDPVDLAGRFDRLWPTLDHTLRELATMAGAVQARRSEHEMIEELLVRVGRLGSSGIRHSREPMHDSHDFQMWAKTVDLVEEQNLLLAAFLEDLVFDKVTGDFVRLVGGSDLHRTIIEKPANMVALGAAIERSFGRRLGIQLLPRPTLV